jgi:stage V sporulation protein B
MVVIDNSIVLGRLQSALGYTEHEASVLFGIYALPLTIYNLPPAIVVPVSISIIPAIAAAIAKGRGSDAGVIMQSSLKLVNLIAMPAAAGLMILATPILIALYNYDMQLATTMMIILGAASFFVCLQYITTAILQANGHERVALMTFPVGAIIKIALTWHLSGNPAFGIIASPIGTLACFIVISILNIIFIRARVKERPRFRTVFIRPLLCSAVMAGASYLVYELLYRLGAGVIGTGRFAVSFYLAVSIFAGMALYGLLIIRSRTITMDDLKLVPRGEKLAKVLKIKE